MPYVIRIIDKYIDGLECFLKLRPGEKLPARGDVQYTTDIKKASRIDNYDDAILCEQVAESCLPRSVCNVEPYREILCGR